MKTSNIKSLSCKGSGCDKLKTIPIKVQLNICVVNGGDGSAYIRFFRTPEEADEYDQRQMDRGEGFAEDSTKFVTLEVDPNTGEILNEDLFLD